MFEKRKNGRIIANDYDNVRIALDALGVEYKRYCDKVIFQGHECLLGRSDRGFDHLQLSIEKRFGFRPGKAFLTICIRDIRDELFE